MCLGIAEELLRKSVVSSIGKFGEARKFVGSTSEVQLEVAGHRRKLVGSLSEVRRVFNRKFGGIVGSSSEVRRSPVGSLV